MYRIRDCFTAKERIEFLGCSPFDSVLRRAQDERVFYYRLTADACIRSSRAPSKDANVLTRNPIQLFEGINSTNETNAIRTYTA
ncbi:MAG TPA: hypothetical protein VNN20_03920 [Thermodesulfobacteriota bacterium]|nr:hypothetical protein [Thermodesulfobacteriota bacterium]